jgi:diketogulonate reductase-like aldo/keto reductase
LPHIILRDGTPVPALGLGTWHMGEEQAAAPGEAQALRVGLDHGMTLVDTAEMYGEGGAERVVGEAIRGRRDEVFLVTKFYPHHASRRALPKACEGSLGRLGVDVIDLYLLHWRSGVALEETVEALERLRESGKIRRWGVSNFDVADLEELVALAAGGEAAANQVLYNLARRGIEVMAYSPLDEGTLVAHPAVAAVAGRIGATPAQVALAWVLRDPRVAAIPKASTREHVRANAAARDLKLDDEALAALDRAFPPPKRKQPLEII